MYPLFLSDLSSKSQNFYPEVLLGATTSTSVYFDVHLRPQLKESQWKNSAYFYNSLTDRPSDLLEKGGTFILVFVGAKKKAIPLSIKNFRDPLQSNGVK